MDLMVCISGELDGDELTLSKIAELGAGIELQTYGLVGVKNEQTWNRTVDIHDRIRRDIKGRVAVHGPFIGLSFCHTDHLLKEAVERRMEKTFEMVRLLRPDTLVQHTNFQLEFPEFDLVDLWLEQTSAFWRKEAGRYKDLGVTVVLENLMEAEPALMIELHNRIDRDNVKLCLDVGHAHVWSNATPHGWAEKLGARLHHVHLHDNHGKKDEHLPTGQGNIDFEALFEALKVHAPEATVSLEVDSDAETKLKDLGNVRARYFGSSD